MPYVLYEPEAVLGFTAYEPPTTTESVEQTGHWRDYWLGGKGHIVGTVKEKGTVNTPLVRRVRLHRMDSGLLVGETWSDAAGNYEFRYLDMAKYYAVTFDHLNNYRGVVADNLSPEL